MLISCAEMAAAERRFFATRSAEPWMDEAGQRCAAAIIDFFPKPGHVILFCGRGNNGGDALVIGRWLRRQGWTVEVRCAGPLSPLARKKSRELESESAISPSLTSPSERPLILVDGLLGIGAKGDLRGLTHTMAIELNRMRTEGRGTTFAVDLPSGFDADAGIAGQDAVIADYTLSITLPKIGFVQDGAENYLGRLIEIPLDIPLTGIPGRRFLFPSNLRSRLPRRLFDTHKGTAGKVVIAAGSVGMEGSAILTALGASRGGSGLVTIFTPEEIRSIVAMKVPAEVMVRSYRDFREISDTAADAYVVGPGLGGSPLPGLGDFLAQCKTPMIVDADALNFLSRNPPLLARLPLQRLLTPHPGEMARLFPRKSCDWDRATWAEALMSDHQFTLLLKGARTLIMSPGKDVEYNTTGHPGMASGGMGDVLSGLCGALVGQGCSLHDAGCLGSWLLGRSAELALRNGMAPESISAPVLAESLGLAMRALTNPDSP